MAALTPFAANFETGVFGSPTVQTVSDGVNTFTDADTFVVTMAGVYVVTAAVAFIPDNTLDALAAVSMTLYQQNSSGETYEFTPVSTLLVPANYNGFLSPVVSLVIPPAQLNCNVGDILFIGVYDVYNNAGLWTQNRQNATDWFAGWQIA